MQRDRQVGHQRLGRQLVDHRHEAHGGQGDAAGRHRQPVGVVEQRQRLHGGVVVVQRLAHAHEHDVERRVEQSGGFRQHAHLAGDFAGGQVPHEPHLAREAEGAAHGAAHLRRHAEGLRRACRECRRTRSAGRSASASTSFCVPSSECSCRTIDGVAMRNRAASSARRSRPRSLMPPKSVAPRFQIHWKICRARKRGSPCDSTRTSSAGSVRSARSVVEWGSTGYLARRLTTCAEPSV